MCQIPFIQLSLLLLIMMAIVNVANGMINKYERLKKPLLSKEDIDQQSQFEVIEDDTTEEEDMEKAMKIQKKFFWRVIMAMNCKNNTIKKPEQIGFQKSYKELVEICEYWKMLSIAAEAYLKSWKRYRKGKKQEKEVEVGTNSTGAREIIKIKEKENPLECHCMKPKFLLVGQGEMQMSSAMEVLKPAYLGLFKCGTGKHLKINVELENQKQWEMVAFLVQNLTYEQLNELKNELQIPSAKNVEKFDAFMTPNFALNGLNYTERFDIVSSKFQCTCGYMDGRS